MIKNMYPPTSPYIMNTLHSSTIHQEKGVRSKMETKDIALKQFPFVDLTK